MTCATRNYNKKITIEDLTGTTADAAGHVDSTADSNWSEHTAAYAAVQTKGGTEFWKVDKVDATVSHVWWCKYSVKLAAVTPDMRLKMGSTVFEIVSAQDVDEAHREVEIQSRRAV